MDNSQYKVLVKSVQLLSETTHALAEATSCLQDAMPPIREEDIESYQRARERLRTVFAALVLVAGNFQYLVSRLDSDNKSSQLDDGDGCDRRCGDCRFRQEASCPDCGGRMLLINCPRQEVEVCQACDHEVRIEHDIDFIPF